jgi:hypothetical protein
MGSLDLTRLAMDSVREMFGKCSPKLRIYVVLIEYASFNLRLALFESSQIDFAFERERVVPGMLGVAH